MGLIDRIFGRKHELDSEPRSPGASTEDDPAVEQYQRMLRDADPDTIERVHVEAFEKLTPEQLDAVFQRFTDSAATDQEKPADARPSSLARSAAQSESRHPGAIARALNPEVDGVPVGTLVAGSLLDTVATVAIASALWGTWDADPGLGADGFNPDDLGGFTDGV